MSLKDQGCNYNKEWSQLQYTGAKAHVIKNFKTNKQKQTKFEHACTCCTRANTSHVVINVLFWEKILVSKAGLFE